MNSNTQSAPPPDNDASLRELAQSIAQKEWHAAQPDHFGGWWVVSTDEEGFDPIDESADGGFSEAKAKFIAAANPAQILNLLDRLESLEKERETLRQTWQDAYAAFKGAFDTPVARRKVDDEYAADARVRLAAINDLLRQPPEGAFSAPKDVLSTSKAPRAR